MAAPYTRRFPAKQTREWVANFLASPLPDECVNWPFAVFTNSGKPRMTYLGKGRFAARAILSMHTGVHIETDMLACHGDCHNILCVNPQHLYWGDGARNMADRKRDGTNFEGSTHPRSKLTEHDVPFVRALSSVWSYAEIGRAYNVNNKTIWNVCHRKTWQHVD